MAKIQRPQEDNGIEEATAQGFGAGFGGATKASSGSTPIADKGFKKPELGGSSFSNQGYQPGMLTAPQGYDPTQNYGSGFSNYSYGQHSGDQPTQYGLDAMQRRFASYGGK